tara:strand:- start:59 stop:307 length:249 start_codon:yes stop_codon:yes gene_type:complete
MLLLVSLQPLCGNELCFNSKNNFNLHATVITVLDFKMSNTFEECCKNIKAQEQQSILSEMGVKTFLLDHAMRRSVQESNFSV